jgi:hypothetical protein
VYVKKVASVSPSLAHWVNKVLKHTEYISYDRLIRLLKEAFTSLRSAVGDQPITILLTSEEYMVQLLWKDLKTLNIIDIHVCGRDGPIKTPIVVWIDDASYSGGNQAETMFSPVLMEGVEELHILLAASGTFA